jgi:hypothetical protein
VTVQDIVALISALGGGAVLLRLIQSLGKWIGGKAGRERDAVEYERRRADEAQRRADEAERELDHEAMVRRKQAEYSSLLRRKMIEHGVPEESIPAWPVDAATMPRAKVREILRKQQERREPRERDYEQRTESNRNQGWTRSN